MFISVYILCVLYDLYFMRFLGSLDTLNESKKTIIEIKCNKSSNEDR